MCTGQVDNDGIDVYIMEGILDEAGRGLLLAPAGGRHFLIGFILFLAVVAAELRHYIYYRPKPSSSLPSSLLSLLPAI